MAHFHAVVWIDHREARILEFSPDAASEHSVKSHEPHHIHHKSGSIDSGHVHEDQAYLKSVADALGNYHEILITGPGNAKTQLMTYLEKHAKPVAGRVLAVEPLDHPTDNEIVAFARKRFVSIDRTTPQQGG